MIVHNDRRDLASGFSVKLLIQEVTKSGQYLVLLEITKKKEKDFFELLRQI